MQYRNCQRFIIVLCALGLLGCEADTRGPVGRIELVSSSDPAGDRFKVTGLGDRERTSFAKLDPQEQAKVVDVRVVSELPDVPSLLGELSLEGDAICFTPRFPLEPGVRYRVTYDHRRLPGAPVPPERESVVIEIERMWKPTTKVEQIYPTADQLPENQLKFYIHFSYPMSRGEAYRRVHLLDANGKEIDSVFLELGEELWDGAMFRFTLYFDPGRVKRGLKPREELGPVLVEGRRYTLLVDREWRDATRRPLAEGARKEFSVGPPDDEPIDPATWKLEPPKAGSAEPLVVRFGEPLDHAQLKRVIGVAAESGEKLAGSVRVVDDESTWQFEPLRVWSAGKYAIIAETTLEDLAGNSIGRPFEVDEFGPVQKRVETETVSIPFVVE